MDDESTLYLVRIWRPDGAFRAVVRPVESEVAETFNDAGDLLRFFAHSIGAAPPVEGEGPPREHK